MSKCNTISFKNQTIYCGIDVHSHSWSLCIRMHGIELKTLRTNADVPQIIEWLKRTFPGAEIRSVYEAGFCGFSAHRELTAAGIRNIVVNPADIPTTGKERVEKCDRADCRKLARHLEDGSLTPIDVPSVEIESLRGLLRRETQVRNACIRLSNQLKSALYFHGRDPVPATLPDKTLRALEENMAQESNYAYAQEMLSLIRQLRATREERKLLVKAEHTAIEKMGMKESVLLLTSIRGIAFRSAAVLLAELGDISRFKSRNHLASYVGLAPHVRGSGEGEKDVASGNRKKKQLHYLLIQASWVAVAKDPAMCAYYAHLCQEKCQRKTRAIVSVAKKMLMIVFAILRDRKTYEPSRLFERNPDVMPLKTDGSRATRYVRFAEETLAREADEEDMILDASVASLEQAP